MRTTRRFLVASLALALSLGATGCSYTVAGPVGIGLRGPTLGLSLGSPCASSMDQAPIGQVPGQARFSVARLVKTMQMKALAWQGGTGVVSAGDQLVLSSCQY